MLTINQNLKIHGLNGNFGYFVDNVSAIKFSNKNPEKLRKTFPSASETEEDCWINQAD